MAARCVWKPVERARFSIPFVRPVGVVYGRAVAWPLAVGNSSKHNNRHRDEKQHREEKRHGERPWTTTRCLGVPQVWVISGPRRGPQAQLITFTDC